MLTVTTATIPIAIQGADPETEQRLRHRYAPWLSDASPALTVTVAPEPAASHPRRAIYQTVFRDGRCQITAPAYDGHIDLAAGVAHLAFAPIDAAQEIDYFIRVLTAILAFEHGHLLLHAAGVEREGRGYCFVGPSGVGKSTLARLSALLPATRPLNDDLLLLRHEPGWQVDSTPFWNWETPDPLRASTPRTASLTALCLLRQAAETTLAPERPAAAVAALLAACPIVTLDAERLPRLTERLQRLVAAIPTVTLAFRRDTSFWELLDARPDLDSRSHRRDADGHR